MCESKKTHQVEVLEQMLIYYSRVLKKSPIQLITPLSDLSCKDLQYASTLVMAPLPCNSQLYILPINIFDDFRK